MMINKFRILRRATAVGLAILMASTSVGTPRLEAMMAPSQAVSNASVQDREKDIATIRAALENKVVRQRLADLGLTQEQIDSRLSKLDSQKLHQVAVQIEKQNPAGDAVGVLVIVVLVLLVIYLFKRV